ncbi:MAG: hypothetical protein QOJ27_2583 [Sphingomonadales bacterium]|nr:hypothetical protein [Sphingomonadales bacterium]
MTHNRLLALGAAASLLIAGAAGAAFAHPHPDGDGKTVERVVIIRDGGGGEHRADADGPRVHRFEMVGGDLAGCDGGEKVVDDSSGDGGKKTKVIICTKGQPSAATAQHLEEALARINSNDDLSDEQKARITTALRSAIDRARGAR